MHITDDIPINVGRHCNRRRHLSMPWSYVFATHVQGHKTHMFKIQNNQTCELTDVKQT